MDNLTFLENIDATAIDSLYKSYKNNPESVNDDWAKFFQGFDFALTNYEAKETHSEFFDKEFKVLALIDDYRKRGHFFTKTNPVRTRRKYFPTLDIENFDLTDSELENVFQSGKTIGLGPAPLKEIINFLQTTYCNSIGVEFMYIREPERVKWLQDKMESKRNTSNFSAEEKKEIYHCLKKAVGFETYIHKKFVGQKRFSLEGAESLIPALDALIQFGSGIGVEEFIIGMPHRGRLNVLTNILQKPYENIFTEFIGKEYDESIAQGDVKYHLGLTNTITSKHNKSVSLNLVPNPSHLETVGAVAQGIAHAQIKTKFNNDFQKLTPVIIHGDAAIATQGIVYEIIQMSQLPGYLTGGSIHLVINNQVGFTTNFTEARSSTYCTDIGKVVKAPIFHVNGDDVEALVYTIELALEYRQKFNSDIFIDLLCYRRYGHNEGDEPRFTQPVLYKEIEKHPNVRDIYSKKLIEEKIVSKEEVQGFENDFFNHLESEANKGNSKVHMLPFLPDIWKNYRHSNDHDFLKVCHTSVDKQTLINLAEKINYLPVEKSFFSKIVKLTEARKEMIKNNSLDWALCELLAYSSLVNEGYPVRLSGQDSQRGTFSHRHAALIVEDTTDKYFPLKHISENQSAFDVFNSPLSEYGVLGFEYGYSLIVPYGLTIWEAQFGDFFNVAQAVIDQYISSAEEKWGLMSGLVMLLPHGYEGQGPEHSSARVERFLSQTAGNNIQVANCSTPASFFHILRRQIKTEYRKPLIVFTPKSLLRHPQCVSSLDELSSENFKEIIDDTSVAVEKVQQIIFCTGKVYYDLRAKQKEHDITDVAIVRIEQLYPFPKKQIDCIIKKYNYAKQWLWVQEEPSNMGAWNFIKENITDKKILCISRPASGSPASGLHEQHIRQQQKIMDKAFSLCSCENTGKYCGMRCDKVLFS